MRKYYKMGNCLLDEEVLRAHRIIEIDGQFVALTASKFVALTASKFDAGSPESAKRAFDAIALLLGAEDLLAPGADEGGDEKPAVSEPDADGWTPWSGGECPVPEGTRVDVRHRDGYEFRGSVAGQSISSRKWRHDGERNDIVAYRVVSEAPVSDEPDAKGWILWTGGECPVQEKARVEIRLSDGSTGKDTAACLRWEQWGVPSDIVAYRVVSEAPADEKKDEPWRPNDGEKYAFLDDGGDIFTTTFYADMHYDRIRVAFGNCFRTREEAEAKRAEIIS